MSTLSIIHLRLMRDPIRIISDLHLGHPASLIEDPTDLAPLLKGIGTMVFNGDSAEMRYIKDRDVGQKLLECLREFCQTAGVDPVFVGGNHDPSVTAA